MDETVLAAMARWPNVPDVYGWLSLSQQGQWQLHPEGNGWTPGQPCKTPPPPGDPITSKQINAFINRNYTSDAHGRWYFQNGPQRVYVRLDAAPYILATTSMALDLVTHNGLQVQRIDAWWLDDRGRLYAVTEHGPGLVSGRDAPAIFEALHTVGGEPLLYLLEPTSAAPDHEKHGTPPAPGRAEAKPEETLAEPPSTQVRLHSPERGHWQTAAPAPLYICSAGDLAVRLGFIACPEP